MVNMSKNSKEQSKTGVWERYVSILSLTSTRPLPGQLDVSSDTLNAFYAGKLNKADEERVFQYIEQHPDIMQQWLSKNTGKPHMSKPFGTLWQKLSEYLTNDMYWLRGGVAVASVIAFVTVFSFFTPKHTLSDNMDEMYSVYRFEGDTATLDALLPWLAPDNSLGLASESLSKESQSFGVGLLLGVNHWKRQAGTVSDLQDSIYSDEINPLYVDLGRWHMLLFSTVKYSKYNVEYWREQLAILALFNDSDFGKDQDSDLVISHLNRIKPYIKALSNSDISKRKMKMLEQELTRFRLQLSPQTPPVFHE